MFNVGFTPQGDWFVFDENGKTIERGFRTRSFAEVIAREMNYGNRRPSTQQGDRNANHQSF